LRRRLEDVPASPVRPSHPGCAVSAPALTRHQAGL